MIDFKKYHHVATKFREFFNSKGMFEVPAQTDLSILACCENPKTVSIFTMAGMTWPQQQSGQMVLEEVLLKNPDLPGVYCFTTSYRDEVDSEMIPGRHDKVFPMVEFEITQDFDGLLSFQKEILEYLNFSLDNDRKVSYLEALEELGLRAEDEIEAKDENKLGEKNDIIYLHSFPEHTHPFFNMKRFKSSGLYQKIDILIGGVEIFGSAEREVDPDKMRKRFFAVSDKEYAYLLFKEFGEERVMKELEKYLALPMIVRSGCGVGLTRLIRIMDKKGMF